MGASFESIARRFPELLPRYNTNFPGRNVVLFGSFNPANIERIQRTRDTFRELGFFVLAPQSVKSVGYAGAAGDFMLLETDVPKIQLMERNLGRPITPREASRVIKMLFQAAMRTADINYLVADERGIDDGGYMGLSAAVELAKVMDEKPVIASQEISPTLDARDGDDSPIFAGCVDGIHVATPEEVAAVINSGGRFVTRNWVTTALPGALPEAA